MSMVSKEAFEIRNPWGKTTISSPWNICYLCEFHTITTLRRTFPSRHFGAYKSTDISHVSNLKRQSYPVEPLDSSESGLSCPCLRPSAYVIDITGVNGMLAKIEVGIDRPAMLRFASNARKRNNLANCICTSRPIHGRPFAVPPENAIRSDFCRSRPDFLDR